jgi:hypothetical protein
MAAKKPLEDELTTAVVHKKDEYTGPTVEVFLPELPDSGDPSVKVDQYEHVTIANEKGETCYKVHRGEHVLVPVPVYMVLKARYPKL